MGVAGDKIQEPRVSFRRWGSRSRVAAGGRFNQVGEFEDVRQLLALGTEMAAPYSPRPNALPTENAWITRAGVAARAGDFESCRAEGSNDNDDDRDEMDQA